MEINQKQYAYFFGKFYDSSFESFANPQSSYDLIVYVKKDSGKGMDISSLEGIFTTSKNLESFGLDRVSFRRNQIEDFELKYDGKFHFMKE